MKLPPGLAVAALLLGWGSQSAQAATTGKIDNRPNVALLVGEAGLVFARSGGDGVAAYSLDSGELLHTFRLEGHVSAFDVSPDGRFVACAGSGRVAAWDGRTGALLWKWGLERSGPRNIGDLSFAGDGQSFVLCGYDSPTVVYETRTGRQIRVMNHPPPADFVTSAALDPTGSRGVAIDHGKRLYTFEVVSGAVKDTGVRAAWPVRYSADGRHVACRNDDSDRGGFLRVIDLGGSPSWQDVDGIEVTHLRPTRDGTFLVRGWRWKDDGFGNKGASSVGLVYTPRTGEVREVWKGDRGSRSIDFDPRLMIGAATVRSTTELYDLRTGKTRLRIDGRAGQYLGGSLLLPTACGVAALACCAAVWTLLIGRRATRRGVGRAES